MVWVVLGLAALALESCNQLCTLVDCGDMVEMCVPLASPARLRVCRNALCSEVQYAPTETYLETGIGTIYRFENCVETEVSAVAKDGDIYTLTGWDANGNVTDEYRWTTTYEAHYPNGERCGPECLRPTLTAAP